MERIVLVGIARTRAPFHQRIRELGIKGKETDPDYGFKGGPTT